MNNMTLSDMYCTQCGRKNIPVPRNKGREREIGHLKKMYCIYCKRKTNMVEIRGFGSGYTVDDFELEFNLQHGIIPLSHDIKTFLFWSIIITFL